MKKIKKIAFGVGLTLALFVATLLVLPFVIDVNRFKEPILQKIESQINGKVTLERIGLKLIPFIGLKLENLSVQNAAGSPFGETPIVTLAELDFRVHLKSILQRKIIVTLLLRNPEIRLIKTAQGSNLDLLLKKPADQAQGKPATPEPTPEAAPAPGPSTEPIKKESLIKEIIVERVTIRDGLFVNDDQVSKPPLKIAGLRLDVTNAVLTDTSKPIGIDLGMRLFDAKQENIALEAHVAVDQSAKVAHLDKAKLTLAGSPILIDAVVEDYAVKRKLDLKVSAPSFAMNSIYALMPEAKKSLPPGSSLEGSLGLNLTANGTPQSIALQTGLELKSAAIKYGDTFVKPTGGAMDLLLEATYTPTEVTLENFAFHLLSSAITAKGTIGMTGAKEISLKVESTPLNLKELLTLSPANQTMDVEGAPKLSIEANGSTAKPDALEISGTLSANNLRYAKYPLTNLSSSFNYANQVAHLNELSFNLFEGNFSGSGVVNLTPKPSWDFRMNIEKLNINTTLNQIASLSEVLTGSGNLNLSIKGTGNSAEEMKKTLSGDAKFSLQNGELKTINIAPGIFSGQLLGALSGVGAPFFAEKIKSTSFQELAGSCLIQEGKVIFSNSTLQSGKDLIELGGTVSLEQKLDLKGKYLLSKEATDSWITNPKLRPYLTDKEGRFLLPFVITGELTKPLVVPDVAYVKDLAAKALVGAAKEEVKQKAAQEVQKVAPKAEEAAKEEIKKAAPDIGKQLKKLF